MLPARYIAAGQENARLAAVRPQAHRLIIATPPSVLCNMINTVRDRGHAHFMCMMGLDHGAGALILSEGAGHVGIPNLGTGELYFLQNPVGLPPLSSAKCCGAAPGVIYNQLSLYA